MEDFKLLDGKVGQKINGNILLITMHFFFVQRKKIFNAIKGKNKICWINSDEYELSFYHSIGFYNKFLTKEYDNIFEHISSNFENCSKNDFK